MLLIHCFSVVIRDFLLKSWFLYACKMRRQKHHKEIILGLLFGRYKCDIWFSLPGAQFVF